MPVYSYRCDDCREHLVIEKSYKEIKQLEPFKCPQCKKDMIRDYTSSFILKGDGWAKDGYN